MQPNPTQTNTTKDLYIDIDELYLIDDGSIDTVIGYRDSQLRFADASYWRDESGALDFEQFIEDNLNEIDEGFWSLIEEA